MDPKSHNQNQLNSETDNNQAPLQQNLNNKTNTQSVTNENITQNSTTSNQTEENIHTNKKRFTKSKIFFILFLLLCIPMPPLLIFLVFFLFWFLQNKIVNRSGYTKTKLDTVFKYLIFLIFLGCLLLVLYLWAIEPCDLIGNCVETFMGGGALLLFVGFGGGFWLWIIMLIISVLPVKLGTTKLKTILKSPRYLAYLVLIVLMILTAIGYNAGTRIGWEESIEKYQKEQAENKERARIREIEQAKEEEQKRIEEENFRNANPDIVRDDQRIDDLALISGGVFEFKEKNKKFPVNLTELKASGYEVPNDPLTGEPYKYFYSDNTGHYAICIVLEVEQDFTRACKYNNKKAIYQTKNIGDLNKFVQDALESGYYPY